MTLLRSLALVSLSLVASRTAGQTTAPATPSVLVQHARALPDSTFATVTLTPSTEQFDLLSGAPMLQLLVDAASLHGLDLRKVLAGQLEALGLQLDDLRHFASHGITLGLTEANGDSIPGWLLVVEAGDRVEALTTALEGARQRASEAGMPSQRTSVDGRTSWILRHPLSPLSWTIHKSTLIAGTSLMAVSAAITRLESGNDDGSLAADPSVGNLAGRCDVKTNLVWAWLRPAPLLRLLTAHANHEGTRTLHSVTRALGVDKVSGIGIAIGRKGARYHESIDLVWPQPRRGLLADLFATGTTLPADAATVVPADTPLASLTSLNLGATARNLIAVLDDFAPGFAGPFLRDAREWCRNAKVDPDEDIANVLGDYLAVLLWPDANGQGHEYSLVCEIHDAVRLEQVLGRLLPKVGLPLRTENVAGCRAHLLGLGAPDTQPGFALSGSHLVAASSRRALERTLARVGGRAPAGALVLPHDASAFADIDVATLLGVALRALQDARTLSLARLGRPAPQGDENELAVRAILAGGAQAHTTVRADAGRLSFASESDFAPLTLVSAALALPSAQQGAQGAVRTLDVHASIRLALARIAAAQHQVRSSGQAKNFLPLGQLLNTGAVDADTVGVALNENLCTRDGFVLTAVLAPASDDFVVVAWPANKGTGPVFAADSRGAEAVNEIIARAEGLGIVEVADVYVGGFGTAWRAGWRRQAVAAAPSAAPNTSSPQAGGASVQAAFQAIAALEKTPQRGPMPAVLVEALRSNEPALVARAARALGVLKRSEDVPTLVQLVTEHADTQVRTQAMWSLHAIRDPRSQPAAMSALTSDDPTLRALAASNIGALRLRAAIPALIDVASHHTDDAPDQDRVAALNAIADLGDPTQMLPLAAAVTRGGPAVVQALTYALQSLSQRFDSKAEATALVALLEHEITGVRRYAMQRLAELRDPTTVRALEGRLTREDAQLLPLLQVAIAAVRNDRTGVEESIGERLAALWQQANTSWDEMPTNQRYALLCGGLVLVLLLGLLRTLRARARRRRAGEAWAALTAPSASMHDNPPREVDLAIGESGIFTARGFVEDPRESPYAETQR